MVGQRPFTCKSTHAHWSAAVMEILVLEWLRKSNGLTVLLKQCQDSAKKHPEVGTNLKRCYAVA